MTFIEGVEKIVFFFSETVLYLLVLAAGIASLTISVFVLITAVVTGLYKTIRSIVKGKKVEMPWSYSTNWWFVTFVLLTVMILIVLLAIASG